METETIGRGKDISSCIAVAAFAALLFVALLPAGSEAQTSGTANFGIKNQWALITVDNSLAPDLGKVTSGTQGCVEFSDDDVPRCLRWATINCPASTLNPGADKDVCEASFKTGTTLTLTASPTKKALSCVQWTLGDGTTQTWSKAVAVLVTGDTSLSVGFYEAGSTGTVSISVTDPADTPVSYVSSSPAGIRKCGLSNGACDATFNNCTKITLTAYPNTAKGEFFSGWGDGVCAGSTTNTCSFTLYPDTSTVARVTKKTTKVSLKPGAAKPAVIQAAPEGNQ